MTMTKAEQDYLNFVNTGNIQKPNSEIKNHCKYICNDCRDVENQEKQFIRNELERIYKRAEALSDNYVTSRISKITGALDKMWEQQHPNKKTVKLFEETDIDGKPFNFD